MAMRNRDPRFLLLLFSLVPFILWIGGALVIWQFWQESWGPTVGGIVVASGFGVVRIQDRILAWIYRSHLRGAVAACGRDPWIPVDLEKTGTQDKLHALPDTVGILQKSTGGLVLREMRGREVHLARGQILATNVSKSNMSCAILFTDPDHNDLIGFVVVPRCIGASMEVAAYGHSRYQWFLRWADITSTDGTKVRLLQTKL